MLRILVKDLESIEIINQTLPITWVKNETMRTDVMFLWEEFDNPNVVQQFNLNVVDNIKYALAALIWNVLDKDYTHSMMPKMIGTPLYKNMTIRNVNTFRITHEMMKEVEDRI